MNEIEWINKQIERCNYFLELAEDRHDLDTFNHWYAEREKLKRKLEKLK